MQQTTTVELTDQEVAQYRRDGAYCLRGRFDEWLEPLRRGVERNIAEPGPVATEHKLGDGKGRYRRRRGAAVPESDAEQAEREQLAAIGYLEGTQAAHAREGVTRYDPERSAGGLNLYVSAHAPEALLMDMEGREVHRWVRPSADIWPGAKQKRMGSSSQKQC